MELETIYYYFVLSKTLNISNDKWKSAYLDQNTPRNNQIILKTIMSIIYKTEEKYVVIINIYGSGSIFLQFFVYLYTTLG